MHKAQFDVPITLIFFSRPELFRELFNIIKHVRPQKLFLCQDGPRENNKNDYKKIMECRRIAEEIDWECEVYKNYSENNLGCGQRPASGITWTFNHVDRTIILEDDCIPEMSFFQYCKEMLEKYEYDERIMYISGRNHFGEWECGKYSYLFAKNGSIWGWATWKRVWDSYDYGIKLIKDNYIQNLIYEDIGIPAIAKRRLKTWIETNKKVEKDEYVTHWDIQLGFIKYIQSGLTVIPKYNLISNIGVGETSTHSKGIIKSQHHFAQTKPLEFPILCPSFVICDRKYDKKSSKIIFPNKVTRIFRRLKYYLG